MTIQRKWKRRLVIGALVLLVAWGIATVELYRVMQRPPESFARLMAKVPAAPVFLMLPFETLWTHARAGGLRPGDTAPDFTLAKFDHSSTVQLSSLTAQRPVVLVFGSYT
jgi:hypothetical protein